VSLWRRERLHAWLTPVRVALAPAKAWGRRPKTASSCERAVESTDSGGVAPVVAAFETLLAQNLARPASIDILLSDHFVRYAVLAWRPGLSGDEWQAYAQHELERVFGAVSGRRLVRIAPARRGAARIAAAIDAGLVDAVQAVGREHRCRIRSLEPNLCQVVNRSLRRSQGDGHLLVAEQGRLTRLALRDGAWCDVQSIRCGAEVGVAAARMLAELQSSPRAMPEDERIWFCGRADDLHALAAKRPGSIALLPGSAFAVERDSAQGGV